MSAAGNRQNVDVLIVGAGPTGLTLGCVLARHGVSFRIIDKAPEPFRGSRGKGIQPRTLEVFDDLGLARQLLDAGGQYPPMKMHVAFLRFKWYMIKPGRASPDVPYPSTWLVPQWRTEQVLRTKLEEIGHSVEWGSEGISLAQRVDAVTVQVTRDGRTEDIHASYVVGADGGRSFVRKALGVEFLGSTSQEGRMIVGDVHVDGLRPDCWHVWLAKGGPIGLCPLPHSDLFQLMMKIDASEADPELSEAAIQKRWLAATGKNGIRLRDPTWLSVFRPNVRLVRRYRVDRAFLAGDAAHVHTPAGAQGLNTGIQDAYNLGWKLALVVKGAPEKLLDTYEEERMPVAAGVLELSSEIFKGAKRGALPKLRRGDKERQLLVNYRGSSLAPENGGATSRPVKAGDRAPDAPCRHPSTWQVRLFDVFRGPHFTALAFGSKAVEDIRGLKSSNGLLHVASIRKPNGAEGPEALIDDRRAFRRAYGVKDNDNIAFLVRPDGYVGLVATSNWKRAIEKYVASVAGTPQR